ncbi:MAG: TetR/AcrR family transcriptional regulator [Xanthobacteraceae bacterium]
MARIDLARRAQIGRDRRARTRAELIRAARVLYAARTFDSVTVDDVVNAADVAKGTFYVHFDGLDDLQSVLADDLAREFDELLQPRRLSLDDPIERIAAGCGAFINQALHDPAWGALIVRGAAAMPSVARVARGRLNEDIRRAATSGRLHDVAPDIALELILGITMRTMQSAAEGRLKPKHAPAIVAGILRAIGVPAGEASEIALRLVTPDGPSFKNRAA